MTARPPHPGRLLLALGLLALAGCADEPGRPELVWGRRGVQDGDLIRPRAVAIDGQDRLFVVDFTARIQVYDRDGNYLGPTWTTPDYRKGRPSGLGIDRDGHLIVSDSHYSCFRIYTADGKELRKFGGDVGTGPGQLGYISDVVQDEDRNWYVAEFHPNHRITKLDPAGRFLRCWGGEGTEPGQFQRPRALALGPDGLLYVADACNHRVQVFTRDGELVRCWGTSGSEPGQLSYPYDLAFNKAGVLYVVEYGNNRVQKFTPAGESLGCWGGPGRAPGAGLYNPWALAIDGKGRVHVLDTENHRVQRIAF
ncbi:MAG TPA: NHL repeat-containing protein [Gemmataceae bacterium]|jgi:sugar lactone lactonase YvrE|nr:NHL repeat-containing protein [Gemmataceae bacterium]